MSVQHPFKLKRTITDINEKKKNKLKSQKPFFKLKLESLSKTNLFHLYSEIDLKLHLGQTSFFKTAFF